ncbi:SflA family class IV lanthipeptide [Streptomyces melanogenes]|uniref:SflA family class IV lanthipeptide n=1 Tax=Streptomyces melanogenes TaxID=67326 RepID=A0ABZ1XE08_9ACTN|nr:SflA family class IV lanthipeptide [Streptomyces melanogenes]
MSPLALQIRDAGPLEVAVEEEEIPFEEQADPSRGLQACLADPWVTATTRFACD